MMEIRLTAIQERLLECFLSDITVAASKAMSNPIPLIRRARQLNDNRTVLGRDILDAKILVLLTHVSEKRSRNLWPICPSSAKERS